MPHTDIITSTHNSRFKELRRLRRRRERERTLRFVVEGEDLVAAAHRAGRPAIEGYRATGTTTRDAATSDAPAGTADFLEVEPTVLAELSSLGSGTRVIGVYEQRFLDTPVGPLCVYLHGLADPGNVGTILRAAEAFGASCVALGPDCADPHSPKAVRASMGAIFSVPLARANMVSELPGERVALVARAGRSLHELEVKQPLTLLIGAEREGLPQEIVNACEQTAHIPIRSESLNAAMAATIGLYEMSDLEKRGARLAGLRPAAPPSRVPSR
ncbi:MAG TPA: RNA methyltransferase [Solirubrobacteraceae bacterium]|jgi:TrmH family RNA methyltransferase